MIIIIILIIINCLEFTPAGNDKNLSLFENFHKSIIF